MPPGSHNIQKMRDYLILHRFPGYHTEVEDFLSDSHVDVDGASDAVLDGLMDTYDEFFFFKGLSVDQVTLDRAALETDDGSLQGAALDRAKFRALLKQMAEYSDDLLMLNYQDLRALYDTQRANELTRKRRQMELEDRGRFFDEIEARADYGYWGKLASWTASETAALLLGKDPRVVNAKAFKRANLGSDNSMFARRFFEACERIERAAATDERLKLMSPVSFARWVLSSGPDHAEEFALWAVDVATIPEAAVSGHVPANERPSMYKMLAGIAARHYGFNVRDALSDEENPIYSLITNDLNANGVNPLDLKTVRKHLKAAGSWCVNHDILPKTSK